MKRGSSKKHCFKDCLKVFTNNRTTSTTGLFPTLILICLPILLYVIYSNTSIFGQSVFLQKHVNRSNNFWYEANSELKIIVLTFNRHKSLRRLLDSLDKAYYFHDKVVLDIWIDRSQKDAIDRQTFTVAADFTFNKGLKNIHIHKNHVGLYGQWLTTWTPNNQSKEIAVIFEDDITVSPWFYRYLKLVHNRYGGRGDINGFALEQNIKHGSENGKLNVPINYTVFRYPVLGTHGFSPKRDNWIKFLKWYDLKSKESFVPLVPDIVKPTSWYTEFIFGNTTDTMWEMWHIYFAYHNKEWTLYPNFGLNTCLTKHWAEKGLHADGKGLKDKSIKLLKNWDNRMNNLPSDPIHINVNGIPIL